MPAGFPPVPARFHQDVRHPDLSTLTHSRQSCASCSRRFTFGSCSASAFSSRSHACFSSAVTVASAGTNWRVMLYEDTQDSPGRFT